MRVIVDGSWCTPRPNGPEHVGVPKFSGEWIGTRVATSLALQVTCFVVAADFFFGVVVSVVLGVAVGSLDAACVRLPAAPPAARIPATPASPGFGQLANGFTSHPLPV